MLVRSNLRRHSSSHLRAPFHVLLKIFFLAICVLLGISYGVYEILLSVPLESRLESV